MTIAIRSLIFLLLATLAVDAHAAAAVQGSYKGNGQDAKLSYALAFPGDLFSGKPTIELILTEKDTGGSTKAMYPAMFGKFGDALVIKLMREDDSYTVIGSVFRHKGLKSTGTSAIGVVQAKDVKMADGRIRGQLFTDADATVSDEPIAIDLKFETSVLETSP